VARKAHKLLFSAYRLDQYSDPDGFMTQVAAVFCDYTDEVLIRATDPTRRDCIQRRFKFPPSLQEISEALDEMVKIVAARNFVEEREARGFRWISDRRGFFNAAGERYDPAKHRTVDLPKSETPQIEAPR
jgi:hypothetical protein